MNPELQSLLKTKEQLRYAGTALSDLIEDSPYIVHLKDAQTGKYILVNHCWAERLGLEPENISSLTYDDVAGESPNSIYSKWNFGPSFTS